MHGHMADRIGAVPAVRGTACFRALCLVSGVERMLNLPVGDVVLAVNAVGVNGQERGDAVPGSLRDLGGGGACVQPERQRGVPQVVGAAGKSGGSRCGLEDLCAGGVPGAAVTAFAERYAAGSAEQPVVGCGAVAAEVVAEHGDQDGRDGNGPDRSLRPVFEAALFVAGAVAGPGCGGAGRGPGEGEHPPAMAGEVAVGSAQGDGFFRTQRGVVQAAEERCQVWPDPSYGGEQGLGLRGLATTFGSTVVAAFGACQVIESAGLEVSSPASTA